MKITRYIVLIMLLLPALAAAQQSTIADARVGEWAVYQAGNGQMQERHSVIARKQDVVVVKIENIVNGRTISSKTMNYNANAPSFLEGANGQEQVQAAGASYNAIKVVQGARTSYYSNDVPVLGLVTENNGGRVVKQLVNFGY